MRYFLLFSVLLWAVMAHGADEPVSPLLPDAVKLLASADSDIAEIEAKSLKSKHELYTALIPKLVKAQETATKAGKLDAANAVKAKVEEYKAKVDEIVALKTGKPAVTPIDSISGVYYCDFVGSDHKGKLELRGDKALESGIKGDIVQDGDKFILLWSNGTQWTIQRTGKELICTSGAGEAKLKKLSK